MSDGAMSNGSFSGWAVGVLAAVAIAGPVRAQDAPRHAHSFEITPFAGYMGGGEFEDSSDASERNLDEGSIRGAILDFAAEPWRHYELLYSSQSTELDGDAPLDMDIQYLQIGGIVSHPDARYVIPYFGLTLGATRLSPDETGLDDETKLSFSAAGGVRVPITAHFGLRLDLRAFVTLLDSEGELFCVSSGGATCGIRAKSDTFLQYSAALGVTIAF